MMIINNDTVCVYYASSNSNYVELNETQQKSKINNIE